jgi:hypothetical protein
MLVVGIGIGDAWRFASWLFAVLLAVGCDAEKREPELTTEVLALSAPPLAAARPAPDIDWRRSPCPDVERQARELGSELPRQLDADTRAARVSARGCDLTLEYELVTLSARDVVESGMRAMRGRVIDQLCSDVGALGVMQRGGRFTNVYYDRVREPIGVFTVGADDCGI